MLKKILSYGAVEGIAKGLNKLILLLLPFFLITEEFGKVGLIISIETLLPFFTILGFERVILRFYSEAHKYPHIDKTINVALNYSHFLVLILLGFSYLLGFRQFFGLELFPDLILLVILVYLQSLNMIVLNKFRVAEKHKDYFKSRLFLQVGKFLLVILLIYITKSYLGYLYGGIIIAVITNIIFRIQSAQTDRQKFDLPTFKYFFNFSWPFIFHGISLNLLGNADKFILENYLSLKEVGQYTFIYSIGSMMVFGFVGISIYLEPIIYKSDEKKREDYIQDYIFYGTLIFTVLFFITSLFSNYFVQYIYSSDFSSVSYLIPLIAISFVLYPYYLTANYRLIYDKKTKKIAIFSVLTCVLNIGLNFLLIPIYGLFASVFITYISYFIQALVFNFISNGSKFTRQSFEIIVIGVLFFILILYKISFYIITVILILFIGYIFYLKQRKRYDY